MVTSLSLFFIFPGEGACGIAKANYDFFYPTCGSAAGFNNNNNKTAAAVLAVQVRLLVVLVVKLRHQ